MSKFNKTKVAAQPDAVTYEGGATFTKNLEQDWLNNLFSNMLEKRFYESSDEQLERYIDLTEKMLEKYGPKFVARASVFARNECGMRSVSQITAAMLNAAKFEGKRDFFKNYFHRPDDVAEIFAILEDVFKEKRSHALVRGAADYISQLNEYSLDKYRMTKKNWSMFDIINMTHAHSDAIDKFKNGTIEKAGTWEQKISAAKTKEEKAANWRELVEQGKLGYLALIRNLNNILNANVDVDWISNYLVPSLTNDIKIRKSLVFPYQIYTAYKNLEVRNWRVDEGLDKAFRIAIGNMPCLDGNSLVILDVSGSMHGQMSGHSGMSILEVGACYAAAIYLSNENSDFVKLGTYHKFCEYNRLSNVFEIIRKMQSEDGVGYNTNIAPVFKYLSKHYDRIFLISDMQVMRETTWWGKIISDKYNGEAFAALNSYISRYGKTRVYSYDLGNYKTQISNPNRGDIVMLTALNEQVFKMMQVLELGGNIVDYINEKYADVI